MFAIVLGLTVLGDQGSKAWARALPTSPPGCTTAALAAHACDGVAQPVIAGYWDWQLEANAGAAFSSFVGARVALSLLAVAALLGIGLAARRTAPEAWPRRAALALIAGGALGNLIDRVRAGAVTDFVHWHWQAHDWPVFNVADVALLLGVLLLTMARSPKSRDASRSGAMLTA